MKRTIKCILSLALAVLLFAAYLPASVNAAESYTRLFGETRYETAFAAADALKEQLGIDQFDTIVVADGFNFADALSGSYLATAKNAPILLVSDSKIGDVQAYISENLTSDGMVYILGGTNAVSADVENSLASFDVVRLAGATRYETNLKILEEAGVDSQEILICTGNSFADSLSASAVGKPILLVGSALTKGQKAFLESSSGEFIIIGGTNTVSEMLEKQLSEYGVTERLSGASRYETSVMVAERFFTKPGAAVLAYAKNFPDGLCGGPLAYAMGAPMILTATGSEAAADAYAAENGIASGIVLGGNGLISDGSCQKIFDGNGHSHSYTKKVSAPTCTAKGYTTYTCACGHSYKDSETAALGHKWGDWKVIKEPTTNAEGQETRTCSTCGATETRAVDKLPEETKTDGCPHEPNGYHTWRSWVAIYDEETGELLYWERTCAWTDCNGRETREAVTPPEDTEPEDGCDKHDYEWVCDSSWEFDTGTCKNCGATKVIYASSSTTSQAVVDAINAYRTANGLSALQYDSRYDTRICMLAAEITIKLSHVRLDGSQAGKAECIGAGYGSAQAAVDAWYNSSSHNGIIMNANATRAAAAYNGSYWVVWIM